jgi:hypothetical protein
MERALGTASMDVHRDLKGALDPQNILNPGKVFPPSKDAEGLTPKANRVARSAIL